MNMYRRNSDLVVFAKDSHGPFLIAVEAKADEPYGEIVADALAASLERYLENDKSNGIARIEELAHALLGARKNGDPAIKGIRYQLLTACAGAIAEAERRGFDRALVLIHEFRTSETEDDNHLRNAADLNIFLKRISHGGFCEVRDREIVGPMDYPSLAKTGVSLFVGKVSRNLRSQR